MKALNRLRAAGNRDVLFLLSGKGNDVTKSRTLSAMKNYVRKKKKPNVLKYADTEAANCSSEYYEMMAGENLVLLDENEALKNENNTKDELIQKLTEEKEKLIGTVASVSGRVKIKSPVIPLQKLPKISSDLESSSGMDGDIDTTEEDQRGGAKLVSGQAIDTSQEETSPANVSQIPVAKKATPRKSKQQTSKHLLPVKKTRKFLAPLDSSTEEEDKTFHHDVHVGTTSSASQAGTHKNWRLRKNTTINIMSSASHSSPKSKTQILKVKTSKSTKSSTTKSLSHSNPNAQPNDFDDISLDDEEFSQLINFDVSGGPELEVSHPHTDDLDLIDLEVNPTDIVSSILSDMLQSMHLQMCGSVNVDVHNVHDNVFESNTEESTDDKFADDPKLDDEMDLLNPENSHASTPKHVGTKLTLTTQLEATFKMRDITRVITTLPQPVVAVKKNQSQSIQPRPTSSGAKVKSGDPKHPTSKTSSYNKHFQKLLRDRSEKSNQEKDDPKPAAILPEDLFNSKLGIKSLASSNFKIPKEGKQPTTKHDKNNNPGSSNALEDENVDNVP